MSCVEVGSKNSGLYNVYVQSAYCARAVIIGVLRNHGLKTNSIPFQRCDVL